MSNTQPKTYRDLERPDGAAIRVARTVFKGRVYVDVRYYFRAGDTDELRPTKKGAALRIGELPALRAAIEAAEQDALRDGLLEPEHYTDTGLAVPEPLRKGAGGGR